MALALTPRQLAGVALAVVATLIFTRIPDLFTQPRLWWDEGPIVFKYAYEHGWLATLLSPHQGYFSLINNLAGLGTKLVPMEQAPLVTTGLAFLVQLLPHAVVWLGQSPYWNRPHEKVLASMCFLYIGTECTLWLNVVTAQFHLSLTAFLILMEPWQGRSRACRGSYMALLALAGLSGVASCFLMPLFLYRAWRERSPLALQFATVMMAACSVQLMTIVWWQYNGEMLRHESRFTQLRPAHLLERFVRRTVAALYSGPASIKAWRWHSSDVIRLGLVGLAGLIYLPRILPRDGRVYFVGAFLLIALLSLVTSLESRGAIRYFYAPCVILMLMTLQSLRRLPQGRREYVRAGVAASVLLWSLGMGMSDYYGRFTCYNPRWPEWTSEVRTWQRNPQHVLRIHTYPRWFFRLEPQQ
ncbi:MAG: hypothetical protein EBV03_05850 [Proteobacteria bacterium]|nr:hypothetical protein [Pseudomonadota bacterium]